MAKRPAEEITNGEEAYLKRQKLTISPAGPPIEIQSGKQLRQVLAFDQNTSRSKLAIQSFKFFLDGFATAEGENGGRIAILRDYLELETPSDDSDKDHVFLNDLMQAWGLACYSNDENLQSAVPAVLALLMKTMSNILDLSAHGLRLGRSVLRQKVPIAKGLEARKGKDFVISPVLRLLREITVFDGGALAKSVWFARDHFLKYLARNLSIRYLGAGVEDPRKPSVRTNSLRFLVSLIKFLPLDLKRDLLNQRDIISAMTKDLIDDPAYMVRDFLETVKSSILLDEGLPREAKTKIFSATVLGRFAKLYQYDQAEEETKPPKKPVYQVAHELLLLACTSPKLGVLISQSSLYPRGINPDDTHALDLEESSIDLGLDSVDWMDKFNEKVPVRNTILSEFIQSLRPWSHIKQSELLTSILNSAPELIADYYHGKKDFSFDPKPTATWIGYSAFIFTTLQLPIPVYFGHQERYARLPPPPSVVLESILPQPLSQKNLTRCLNLPNNNLITFFAVRILCVVFGKLQEALKMYREAANGSPSSLWAQAAEALTDEFCRRCPAVKDVILAFRRLKDTDLMQKEATTKLLVLYYEVVPRIALDAKFGVSAALAGNLKAMEDNTLAPADRVLRAIELEHLFQFANFSPGMRWFSKVEGLSVTPFMAMLKLSAEAPVDLPMFKLRAVLASVVKENQILQTQTAISALDTLVLGLRTLHERNASSVVYNFLDDCISRCASKPIKYIFALEEISAASDHEQAPVSLLSLAIVEQWPFLAKSASRAELEEVAELVARYLAASIKIQEDKVVLKLLVKKIAKASPEESQVRKIIEQSRKLVDNVAVAEKSTKYMELKADPASNVCADKEKMEVLAKMDDKSANPAEDHKALTKWTTKEIDEVVDGGHSAALIMLLSSEHLSVRKEALTNISKVAAKLDESTLDEKKQLWLLLNEVVETAKKIIDQEPMPTAISAFASHSIAVLNDPLHIMYGKVNLFLSQGPTWDLDKLPLMHKILDHAPKVDDAHSEETAWFLNYILAGLQTSADMGLYRKRQVFEKLLSLYSSSYLGAGLRDKILRIFFRATRIEGGSSTLVTRFSAMTWLEAQVSLGGGMPLKVLIDKILESCDQKRVKKWSKGAKKGKAQVQRF
ncbi:uncharacterized protein L3040_005015 [Drepanopeziza brunnea f. sp. 'multigermtubi']|uniref:Ribosome biogenesis protein Urb1 n=1 Tax=Marssonina brunnea f. sp. multigermtubi (strain MB_m1) TaxID=1072389 RepID=K1WC26_MARBU|nr:ribosome biogenesis protein Urb1 [Drepanopeziza brunnea f. sp. 'multigermtubi' MB_m1]EKD14940.1 ribosome biogenesis protein Urb1 [Drepanopeziza brunnea f. sp. 'multigermtubi' MB_m1]KAJ5042470.1 hypothetical protein L3040_005015 [Drepanopeziza brunnea f. sp. 'multigermtubi']